MSDAFYNLSANSSNGKEFLFSALKGKVVLIVNTASKCGFAPQYTGLEALHQKYKDRGLVVLGFPCDQFAHQEPLKDDEVASFCQLNFGVTFPLMAKIDVNGAGTHPVFAFLKARTRGLFGSAIKWNFTKFLVGRDGRTVARFAPAVEPARLESYIEAALSA
jgi:glutathione peroxidase